MNITLMDCVAFVEVEKDCPWGCLALRMLWEAQGDIGTDSVGGAEGAGKWLRGSALI